MSTKKTYELSIARGYVHTWGIAEAIREIVQNAIDSETDGNPMSITYSSGTLIIQNLGCNLDISTLVLGHTEKTDPTKYIGQYGEGFKLALVVLLRNDVEVVIHTNKQTWTPEFRKSAKFKLPTLHIDVVPTDVDIDQIVFEIKGISYNAFEELRNTNLAIAKAQGFSIGEILPTMYGDILLEPRYKGKMFVNGLYVQSDSSFNYGYDFKPEYLHLDRDRKAINYYKMRELTAKAMTSQSNVKLVHTAMTKHYTDVSDVISYMDSVSQEFKVNFAHEFMTSHELDEDTFVGLEKETKVSTRTKTFRTNSIAIAELVNAGLGREEEYAEVKVKVKALTEVERAENYYYGSHFERLVDYLLEHKDNFDVDDLVEELRALTDLHTSNFNLISDKVFSHFYEDDDDDDEEEEE